jgi:hypothetical protein
MTPAPSLQEVISLVETETEDTSPLGRLRAASGVAGNLAEVGDAALGYFVDQARHAGHSWSDIGAALGVSKQAAQQRHTVRRPAAPGVPALHRYTPPARSAVRDAEVIAREWGHQHVGTEHLLLAMYRHRQGVAAQVLIESGLSAEQAIHGVEQRVPRGDGAHDGTPVFTPRARAVLAGAVGAASDLGHDHVGTEHLLLALGRVDGVAGEVLADAGLTAELIAQRVGAKVAS